MFNSLDMNLYYDGPEPCLDLSQREISFTISRGLDDFFLRWLSVDDHEHFKKKVLNNTPCPHKIDIGAVYNHPISSKDNLPENSTFVPIEKELVFDIDMNDYDDIRTCCKDKIVCSLCWKFLALASNVLELTLKEDFGFQNIFWVYSGRRGLHGWVCDKAARELPSEARNSIINYINLISATFNRKKRVRLFTNTPHPMVKRSFENSLKLFEILLTEQNFFQRDSSLVSLVDDFMSQTKQDIKELYFHKKASTWDGSSLQLWKLVLSCCLPRDMMTPIELLLSIAYPRLDVNVTKDIAHLLKSPFSVHKATGHICVPIPREMLVDFNPEKAPHISSVRLEFIKNKDISQTSLYPYLEYFRKEVVDSLKNATKPAQTVPSQLSKQEIIDLEKKLFEESSLVRLKKGLATNYFSNQVQTLKNSLDW